MEESKELKVGDTATYAIADKVVTMAPVTLGKMKRAMEAFKNKDVDSFEMMREHLFEILSNGKNEFLDRAWIEENVTLPQATRIISDMRIINGLGDTSFFPAGAPKEPKEIRDLSGAATPSV